MPTRRARLRMLRRARGRRAALLWVVSHDMKSRARVSGDDQRFKLRRARRRRGHDEHALLLQPRRPRWRTCYELVHVHVHLLGCAPRAAVAAAFSCAACAACPGCSCNGSCFCFLTHADCVLSCSGGASWSGVPCARVRGWLQRFPAPRAPLTPGHAVHALLLQPRHARGGWPLCTANAADHEESPGRVWRWRARLAAKRAPPLSA